MSPDPRPAPAGVPAEAPDAQEEARAWSAVVSDWHAEAAHRAYLARFGDLEGLAQAGRRYREVLARDPADPVAARWRDDVVKRATAQAFALMPRTAPPRALPRWLKHLLASIFASVGVWIAWKIYELLSRPPVP